MQVLDVLHPAAGLSQAISLIGQTRSAGRSCPRCGRRHWHRHGHANDLQRLRCRECGRTFNDLSGKPLARLRLRGKRAMAR
jgi:transposase-like protein